MWKAARQGMRHTTIIAEIGECYNGEMVTARELIKTAAVAGCDYVKFQTLDYENIFPDDPEADWFRKTALMPETIAELIGFAREEGVSIIFTPENAKTARWLLDAGQTEVKVASNCLVNRELLDIIRDNFERVFISTGMASLDEVNAAVGMLSSKTEVSVLHCVSEYPTGPLLERRGLVALDHSDVRLNMMLMLKSLFPDLRVGYSDHTSGILAPVAAVAAGAEVIEKHITMDARTPVKNFLGGGEYLGTDHVLSIEPAELAEMVRQIREVELMFGRWRWDRSEGEKLLTAFLRARFEGS